MQEYLTANYSEGLDLAAALRLAVDALGHEGTSTREVNTERLEVAVLDRTRSQPRKFRRIDGPRLADLFSRTTPNVEPEAEPEAEPEPAASSDVPSATESTEPGVPAQDDPADEIGDLPDDPDTPPTHG